MKDINDKILKLNKKGHFSVVKTEEFITREYHIDNLRELED